MTREELNCLRTLRAEIESGIRELRKIEKREISAAHHGQSLLRSIKRQKTVNTAEKDGLIHTIHNNQREYLKLRAAMENRISKIPEHNIRTVLSLLYVDGMVSHDAAAVIGGSYSGYGILQLMQRYFGGQNGNDST